MYGKLEDHDLPDGIHLERSFHPEFIANTVGSDEAMGETDSDGEEDEDS